MSNKNRTTIVGGGIIGASIAFFISRHPRFNKQTHEIVLIEAVAPACAASGKAGGLLSKTAFPASLGPLSFKLHAQLAKEFDGENNWGYRRVSTVSVGGSDKSGASRAMLPEQLDWLRPEVVQYVDFIGGPDEFAQVHPYHFTNFMLDYLKKDGVLQVVTGKVTEILANGNGDCVGVGYSLNKDDDSETIRMMSENVIISAGPWTSKLIKECPIVGVKVPSITVIPPNPVSPFALFTELDLENSGLVAPEVYSRKGDIYICGESLDDPLPDTAETITINEKYAEALFQYGCILSPDIAGGKVDMKQACYLPVVNSQYTSGPFVGKTNVNNLLIASGHTCWGINNAPATGLLIAEILFEGRAHTANARGLTPAAYFDASKALTRLEE